MIRDDLLPLGFEYQDGALIAEGQSVTAMAQEYGTPLYLYSERDITDRFQRFQAAAPDNTLICYAVKANPSLAIIGLLARLGAGFDVVSGGEIQRVVAAGGDPKKIIFSGVGKTEAEIRLALSLGIRCLNVESESELRRISRISQAMGLKAPISLRVNPDIDPQTHPYISTGLKENKFGVAIEAALAAYQLAGHLPGLSIQGVDCHIGSQITSLGPFEEATDRVLAFVDALSAAGIPIHHLDLGGGLGIRYDDETPPSPEALMASVQARTAKWAAQGQRSLPGLAFEFGRALVGVGGLLVTRVEALKPSKVGGKHFAVVDAAMNDLMRPSLYEAWHGVLPVIQPESSVPVMTWDLVGPICESGDWLARDRTLGLEEGDLLAFCCAGAYGMSMASNYNTRGRAAELVIRTTGAIFEARRRETFDDLIALESPLPGLLPDA